MGRVSRSLLTGVAALALLALPSTSQAEWDYDWYDGWEYEYGYNEYGYGLDGAYDDEDVTNDWYYDSYSYADAYDDKWEYDWDLFGDDEWERYEGSDLYDQAGPFQGYGYDPYDEAGE